MASNYLFAMKSHSKTIHSISLNKLRQLKNKKATYLQRVLTINVHVICETAHIFLNIKGFNPIRMSLRVIPTKLSGAYFRTDMHRIAFLKPNPN